MSGMRERLFRAVCLTASVLLLMLSLMKGVGLTGLNDRAAELEREIEALEEENRILRVRSAETLPLEQLEDLAIRQYGMQIPAPDQIVWVESPTA